MEAHDSVIEYYDHCYEGQHGLFFDYCSTWADLVSYQDSKVRHVKRRKKRTRYTGQACNHIYPYVCDDYACQEIHEEVCGKPAIHMISSRGSTVYRCHQHYDTHYARAVRELDALLGL